jgi:hypothetical protein
MRRILVETAVKRGYKVFELKKGSKMTVAILKDGLSIMIHDITNSKFVSGDTLMGSTDSRLTEYEHNILKMTLINQVINFCSASSGKEITSSFQSHAHQ